MAFRAAWANLDDPSPKHLEIPSFNTTVRHLSDRSRPPQGGGSERTHLHCVRSPNSACQAPRLPQSPPFQTPPRNSATRFAFPPTPRRTAQPSAENRGARGELFPPHAFPAFLPFCVSRCGRSAGRRRRVCLCAAFVTKNTLFLHGQSGACVLELRACA